MLLQTSITDSQNSCWSIQECSSETYRNRLSFSHWMASQETEITDIRQPPEEDSLMLSSLGPCHQLFILCCIDLLIEHLLSTYFVTGTRQSFKGSYSYAYPRTSGNEEMSRDQSLPIDNIRDFSTCVWDSRGTMFILKIDRLGIGRAQLTAPREFKKERSDKVHSQAKHWKCGFGVKYKKNTIVSVQGTLFLNGQFIHYSSLEIKCAIKRKQPIK